MLVMIPTTRFQAKFPPTKFVGQNMFQQNTEENDNQYNAILNDVIRMTYMMLWRQLIPMQTALWRLTCYVITSWNTSRIHCNVRNSNTIQQLYVPNSVLLHSECVASYFVLQSRINVLVSQVCPHWNSCAQQIKNTTYAAAREVVLNYHHFNKRTQRSWDWEGAKGRRTFFRKCRLWCIAILRASKTTFSKYSFCREGGVHKKTTLCTLLIMLTIIFWTAPK